MKKLLNLFLVLVLIFSIISITGYLQINKPSKNVATFITATFRRADYSNNNLLIHERYYPWEVEKGTWKLIKASSIAYLVFPLNRSEFKPSTLTYGKMEKEESKWIAVMDDEGNLWIDTDSIFNFSKNYFDTEGYYHYSDDVFSVLAD